MHRSDVFVSFIFKNMFRIFEEPLDLSLSDCSYKIKMNLKLFMFDHLNQIATVEIIKGYR